MCIGKSVRETEETEQQFVNTEAREVIVPITRSRPCAIYLPSTISEHGQIYKVA